MSVCTRDCHWPEGAKRRHCPEFHCTIYRRWCELAKTREPYYEAYREGRGPGQPALVEKAEKRREQTIPDELKAAAAELGITDLTRRWAKAVKRWIEAGRPLRSQDEIDRIYAICAAPCKWFGNNRCKVCGCRVAQSGGVVFKTLKAFFNKAAMATEHCPKGFW